MKRLPQNLIDANAKMIVLTWQCRYGQKNIKRLLRAIKKEIKNDEIKNGKPMRPQQTPLSAP